MDKNLKKLEYDKILSLLQNQAVSAPGKELCEKLRPLPSLYEAECAQEETREALCYLMAKSKPPLSGLTDISSAVSRAKLSAILTTRELLNVARVISTIRQTKEYGHWTSDEEIVFSILEPFFSALNPPEFLEQEIRRCILGEDEISDNASPKLSQIRRDILNQQEKIRSDLQKMIHGSSYKTMLQDPVVTIKNGRFCLPIKAEYRSAFSGMIHDQSSSGSTLFIEPMAVVDMNNKITELIAAEAAEIERILSELSARVAKNAAELSADYQILVTLDFIFAKARLALNQNAMRPVLSEDGPVYLPKARHPLIPEKKVVPITLSLGFDEKDPSAGYSTLVITGPNTGGKTVSLKTLGLLSLMAASGLHLPTADGARVRLFDRVFADIGDEQSIEQSLSTFSSHMVNIVEIMDQATGRSLVLFDELGAGTDPTEGAALAQSILENLRQRGSFTAATTHYSELKIYALSTAGVENASCEFDINTLRPTYRLLIGVAGKSNAFAISKRLGLSEEIIREAGNLLEGNDIRFEELMSDLEQKRQQAEAEQARIEALRKEMDALEQSTRRESEKLEAQREKILENAKQQARELIKRAKAEADESIARVNKLIQKGQKVDVRGLEEERRKLRDLSTELESTKNEPVTVRKAKPLDKSKLSVGDEVRLSTFDQIMTIVQKPDSRGRYTVQAGIIKMQVRPDEIIELIGRENEEESAKDKGTTAGAFGKSTMIKAEIDVRGHNVDEAVFELDKYLDDASLSGLDQIRIIHGKGTGALREGIHRYLKRAAHVKSFRLGAYGEGDAGVTVVELKK